MVYLIKLRISFIHFKKNADYSAVAPAGPVLTVRTAHECMVKKMTIVHRENLSLAKEKGREGTRAPGTTGKKNINVVKIVSKHQNEKKR